MPFCTFLRFSTIITDQDGNFFATKIFKSFGKLDNKKKIEIERIFFHDICIDV